MKRLSPLFTLCFVFSVCTFSFAVQATTVQPSLESEIMSDTNDAMPLQVYVPEEVRMVLMKVYYQCSTHAHCAPMIEAFVMGRGMVPLPHVVDMVTHMDRSLLSEKERQRLNKFVHTLESNEAVVVSAKNAASTTRGIPLYETLRALYVKTFTNTNTLNVFSDAGIGGQLAVTGDTRIRGKLYVGDDSFIEGDLRVQGATIFEGGTIIDDNFEITGNLLVDGNTTLNTLTVTGTSTLQGATTVGSTLGVSGLLTAANGLTISNGSLTVSTGNINVPVGNLTVGGNTTLNNLSVTGTFSPTTLQVGTLTVTGTSDLQGATTVGSTLGVTGLATFNNGATVASGDLGVTTGNVTLGSGNLSVGGTSTLTGNTTVGGTLGVTGVTTLSNNTTIGGTLGVTGLLSANGGETITAGGLTVNGGDVAINNNGNLTLTNGNLSVGGTSTLTGNTTVGGTLGVTGQLNANGNAAVTGTLTLNGTPLFEPAHAAIYIVGGSNAISANQFITYNAPPANAISNTTAVGISVIPGSTDATHNYLAFQILSTGTYLINFWGESAGVTSFDMSLGTQAGGPLFLDDSAVACASRPVGTIAEGFIIADLNSGDVVIPSVFAAGASVTFTNISLAIHRIS